MSEYTKSYRVGPDHTVTIHWGGKTSPVATWSPPLTDEQRRDVESTDAYGSLMMRFIGEAMAAVHGTQVEYVYPNPDEDI